ncbi:hypothetical protein AQZ49_02505 [Novosphingobium sp. FSW06-99]|nr:hypothetical protein AQZ49_02505 [Novosphingobium sp. FSW06-99]
MSSNDGGAAPGGAPPAAGDGAPAAPATPDPQLTYAPWMDAFGTEPLGEGAPSARDWVAQKGFKSPDEIARSAREAERALHARIPIPKAEETDKWAEVWNKLGRPETPDKYTIGAPDGFQPDPTFTKAFAESAHAAGLTQAQVEGIVGWWNNTAIQSIEGEKARVDAQKAALQSEWGADYGKNLQFMRRGAEALGFDKGAVDKLGGAFGVDGAAKILADLGKRTSEDLLRSGESEIVSLSVPELQAELDRHKRENGAAIRSGDAVARATYDRLIAQLAAAKKAAAKRD